MRIKNALLLCKGKKFQSQGLGKFAKDILVRGKYVHPTTGQVVDLEDPARLQRLAANTTLYRRNGSKVPFPDGHTFDAMKNLGDWDEQFMVSDDRVWGVVNPKAKGVEERLASGAIDGVSAYIEFDVKDSKGNVYPEVITHICATDYPVVHSQGKFVPLSKIGDKEVPIFLSTELAGMSPEGDKAKEESMLKKIALALGLSEDATEAQVLEAMGKMTSAQKEALAKLQTKETEVTALSKGLKDHGLEYKDGKLVKLDATPAPATEKEKEYLARIEKLEASAALDRLNKAQATAEEWIKKGIVPPTMRVQLSKLFAVKSKVEAMALAADGKGTAVTEVDVEATMKEVLSAIHSVTGVKLSSLTPAPTGEAGEKTPQELAKTGAEIARGLQPEKKTA